jgi:hypothetical protein
MNETYGGLARNQEKAGQLIIIVSSVLAAVLVLAGLIYATGSSHRSVMAAAAAGCEPGLTSESAPCVTQQDLASAYSATMNPAGRQLGIDAAAYASSEQGHLAPAEAALTAEVQVEQALAARLAAIRFPAAMVPQVTALIHADQARAKLTATQAHASTLGAMRSFDHQVQLTATAMQMQMQMLQKAINTPPASA